MIPQIRRLRRKQGTLLGDVASQCHLEALEGRLLAPKVQPQESEHWQTSLSAPIVSGADSLVAVKASLTKSKCAIKGGRRVKTGTSFRGNGRPYWRNASEPSSIPCSKVRKGSGIRTSRRCVVECVMPGGAHGAVVQYQRSALKIFEFQHHRGPFTFQPLCPCQARGLLAF